MSEPMTAQQVLVNLCRRHARVGRCILCGHGPWKATTAYGTCKDCGRSMEGIALERLVGKDAYRFECTGCGGATRDHPLIDCPRPFEHDSGGIR